MADTCEFNDICPRKMVRKTDSNDISGDFMFEPLKRLANLRWIKYRVPEAVLFRILICKEYKSASDPDVCPYPEFNNEKATKKICESKGNLAHIYFRFENTEKAHAGTRSCIVIFSKNNLNIDEFAEKLKATIAQLDIQKEKFVFHVIQFRYGLIRVVMPSRDKLRKKILSIYRDSNIRIKRSIQMNEKDDMMILGIGYDPKANEFLISSISDKK